MPLRSIYNQNIGFIEKYCIFEFSVSALDWTLFCCYSYGYCVQCHGTL